jgi:hypothetical protein
VRKLKNHFSEDRVANGSNPIYRLGGEVRLEMGLPTSVTTAGATMAGELVERAGLRMGSELRHWRGSRRDRKAGHGS